MYCCGALPGSQLCSCTDLSSAEIIQLAAADATLNPALTLQVLPMLGRIARATDVAVINWGLHYSKGYAEQLRVLTQQVRSSTHSAAPAAHSVLQLQGPVAVQSSASACGARSTGQNSSARMHRGVKAGVLHAVPDGQRCWGLPPAAVEGDATAGAFPFLSPAVSC